MPKIELQDDDVLEVNLEDWRPRRAGDFLQELIADLRGRGYRLRVLASEAAANPPPPTK